MCVILEKLKANDKKKMVSLPGYAQSEKAALTSHFIMWTEGGENETPGGVQLYKIIEGTSKAEDPAILPDIATIEHAARIKKLMDTRAVMLEVKSSGRSMYFDPEYMRLITSIMNPEKITAKCGKNFIRITDGTFSAMQMMLKVTGETVKYTQDFATAEQVERVKKARAFFGKNSAPLFYRSGDKYVYYMPAKDCWKIAVVEACELARYIFPNNYTEADEWIFDSEFYADDDPKIIIEDNFHRNITAVKGEKYNYHFYENGLGVAFERK